MNRKRLAITIALILSLLLLSGCEVDIDVSGLSGTTNETTAEDLIPENAVFPVFSDEANGVKEKTVCLTGFSLTLPEGYVYGVKEYDGYNAYYIWRDREDKEYAAEIDGDVVLYIYDGIDTNSPAAEITEREAMQSLRITYIGYLRNLVNGKFSVDSSAVLNSDESYYLACFDGYSGEYVSTTYGAMCYPKTYYGIFAVESKTETFDRHFCGFVFSNDSEGELFKESDYIYLLSEIKAALNVEQFYTPYQAEYNYDPMKDVSNGRSYEQMISLFENTYYYYIETTGRSPEREDVDSSTGAAENVTTGPADTTTEITEPAETETPTEGTTGPNHGDEVGDGSGETATVETSPPKTGPVASSEGDSD